MRFSKYHGIGNDFVMLADPDDRLVLTAELVRSLCDRRFGIGADGVIRVGPGDDGSDLFMDHVNSDGSVSEMCGNGIRCLARFARAEGLTASERISVGTRSGIKLVEVLGDRVRVDMGAPVFEPARIPVLVDSKHALEAKLELDSEIVEATCLSLGNPHAVLFVDDPATAPVTTLGPLVEAHPLFPNKTNVEFVKIESPREIRMRVWERGVGETLACGTGACAAAVAARLVSSAEPRLTVKLPGGELDLEWQGSLDEEEPVIMTGPATKSYSGEFDLEAYR